MVFLNTDNIINNALSMVQDTSPSNQTRFLSYLNTAFRIMANERDWKFLCITANATPAAGIIPFPVSYQRMVSIVGDDFVITTNDMLTENEALKTHAKNKVIEIATGLQLIPATTTDVDLTYIPEIPSYVAGDITLFPEQTAAYFERCILTRYYEFDMDERWSTSKGLEDQMLAALKRWDNMLKPLPQYDSRGVK